MSNGTSPFPPGDVGVSPLGQAGLPPFPTWPPPSGGAPITTPEMGPILNPYPYGSVQGANISTANPYPPGGIWKGTFYPAKMAAGANGQNQGPGYGLPATTKNWEGGPALANPAISAISPSPIMGPGPQGVPPY
jgi:hypothetical protein